MSLSGANSVQAGLTPKGILTLQSTGWARIHQKKIRPTNDAKKLSMGTMPRRDGRVTAGDSGNRFTLTNRLKREYPQIIHPNQLSVKKLILITQPKPVFS